MSCTYLAKFRTFLGRDRVDSDESPPPHLVSGVNSPEDPNFSGSLLSFTATLTVYCSSEIQHERMGLDCRQLSSTWKQFGSWRLFTQFQVEFGGYVDRTWGRRRRATKLGESVFGGGAWRARESVREPCQQHLTSAWSVCVTALTAGGPSGRRTVE